MWYNRVITFKEGDDIQNTGKIFEQDVKNSVPDNIYYYRLPDPPSSFGQDSSKVRFSLKNQFDAFLYKKPYLIAMELKTNQSTSISFSTEPKKQAEIKYTQIEALTKASEFGIRAGLLLNFRKSEQTYWIDINNFNSFLRATDKKSINEKDLISYGAIVVTSKKKKVRFTYDLSFLWKEEDDE